MEFAEGQMKGLGAQPGSTKEVCHGGVIRKVKGAGEWGDSGTGCPRAPFMKDLVRLSVQQLSAVRGFLYCRELLCHYPQGDSQWLGCRTSVSSISTGFPSLSINSYN